MADAGITVGAVEVRGLVMPVFIFTVLMVTGVLLQGLRIFQSVLLGLGPDNPTPQFVDRSMPKFTRRL